MIGAWGEVEAFLASTPPVAKGPAPLVSNLFRVGIFARCVSTKSTPSAVSVKAELSARVMYPFFCRYHNVNSRYSRGNPMRPSTSISETSGVEGLRPHRKYSSASTANRRFNSPSMLSIKSIEEDKEIG